MPAGGADIGSSEFEADQGLRARRSIMLRDMADICAVKCGSARLKRIGG